MQAPLLEAKHLSCMHIHTCITRIPRAKHFLSVGQFLKHLHPQLQVRSRWPRYLLLPSSQLNKQETALCWSLPKMILESNHQGGALQSRRAMCAGFGSAALKHRTAQIVQHGRALQWQDSLAILKDRCDLIVSISSR